MRKRQPIFPGISSNTRRGSCKRPHSLVIIPVPTLFFVHEAAGVVVVTVVRILKDRGTWSLHILLPRHLSENTAIGSWCAFPEGTVIASVLSGNARCNAWETRARLSAACWGLSREDRGGCRGFGELRSALWQPSTPPGRYLQCPRVLRPEHC